MRCRSSTHDNRGVVDMAECLEPIALGTLDSFQGTTNFQSRSGLPGLQLGSRRKVLFGLEPVPLASLGQGAEIIIARIVGGETDSDSELPFCTSVIACEEVIQTTSEMRLRSRLTLFNCRGHDATSRTE